MDVSRLDQKPVSAGAPAAASSRRPDPVGARGGSEDPEDGWKSYWEELNDRQDLFREQAYDYASNLEAAVPLSAGLRVLDFGCGFGYVAEKLAPKVGELCLWDGAANMRRAALARLARFNNVRLIDLSRPEAFEAGPGFDLILLNSVIQYMTVEEFAGWLAHWRRMLAPGGRLIISDIIPSGYRGSLDLLTILRFCARRGIFLRGVRQAASELFRYFKTRQGRPLTRFGREELGRLAEAAGLEVAFLPRNLMFFPKRVTAVFTDAGAKEAGRPPCRFASSP